MLIRHATVYRDGHFHSSLDLRIMHGVVQEIGADLVKGLYESELDIEGDYLLPGFVDIQLQGFSGYDALEGEASLRHIAKALYRHGVAAFLPIITGATVQDIRCAIDGIHAVKVRPERCAARLLGAHMDLFHSQQHGFSHVPDMPEWMSMIGGRTEDVRLVTVAPEMPGAATFMRTMARQGVRVSIGHSRATAEQTHEAASDGATHVTHIFQEQAPLYGHAPGLSGAAMIDDRLYVTLLGDRNLHPDMIRILLRVKGAEKLIAATNATGEGSHPRNTSESSPLSMPQIMRHLIHGAGVMPEQAARITTETPAESIGEHTIGHLIPGTPAPLTRWSKGWQMVGIMDEHTAD